MERLLLEKTKLAAVQSELTGLNLESSKVEGCEIEQWMIYLINCSLLFFFFTI